MNKNIFRLITVFSIIYIGLMLEVLPDLFYGNNSESLLFRLIASLGGIIILIGVIMFFSDRSEKRIISSLQALNEVNQLGIEKVKSLSNYSFSDTTDITRSSEKVDILISFNQVNKNLRYLIEQLIEKNDSQKIRVLVCGVVVNDDADIPDMLQVGSEQQALSEVIRRYERKQFKNLSLRSSKTNIFHSVILTEQTICLFLPHESTGREGLVTYIKHSSSIARSYINLFDSLWDKTADNIELKG